MKDKVLLLDLPTTLTKGTTIVDSGEVVKQLSLFSSNHGEGLPENKLSNVFNAYDLWSRFVRGKNDSVPISQAPDKVVITRQLSDKINGVTYVGTMQIAPAVITGETIDRLCWPSDREEKVECALISLASQGKLVKLSNKFGENYGVYFTIKELQNELASVKQTLSHTEIKEALTILQGSKLTFSYEEQALDGELNNYQSQMSFISSIHYSEKRGRTNAKCIAVLNEYMSKQIDSLNYQGYYFNRSQKFKRALSRWFCKRLYQVFRYASENKSYHFKLNKMMVKYGAISKEDGLTQAKFIANRRDMTASIKDLIKEGVLKDYKITSIRDDNGKVYDNKYEVFPSQKFIDEMIALNKHQKKIQIKSKSFKADQIDFDN